MRYFISLSFNGSPFSGWQIQENANSVQAELQRALSLVLKEQIIVTGAGRTDSGVNAINYIAHFDSNNSASLLPVRFTSLAKASLQDYKPDALQPPESNHLQEPLCSILPGDKTSGFEKVEQDCSNLIPDTESDRQKTDFLIYKLNAILNKEISVNSIFRVEESMHARFSAISRTYQYHIHTYKNPFAAQFSYYYPFHRLDFCRMNRAAEYFIGCKDFSSLQKAHGNTKTSICTVSEAFWSPARVTGNIGEASGSCFNAITDDTHFPGYSENRYVFTVTADRFLRNMVRAMVGSLIEVGIGKKEPEWIEEMLKAKDRSSAGNSVPGHALFLTRIKY